MDLHNRTTNLAALRSSVTRSISAENPDGAPGGGARATTGTGANFARELGPGWKVAPYRTLAPHETFDFVNIAGEGTITHIWLTARVDYWRTLVLRAFWDGASGPAVEVPYGDFFCNGWGRFAQVNSAMIAANPHGGFNSYWPMPFRTGARLSVENTSDSEVAFFYQVTYEVESEHTSDGYFHAQWRRSNPLEEKTPHVLLNDIEGQGHYVGTYLAWGVNSSGWWGEGEVKFYLDGDGDHPTICGTGTEDYFGGAWNFDVPERGYTPYSTPYLGMPQVLSPDGLYASQQRFGLYRWHVADPIRFREGIRKVDVQALGWRSGERYLPLRDDIASTSMFYLDRPTASRPSAPTADDMEIL